ncbi:MAG: DNA-directed RNA polymerase subunit omega [Candidatus Omnitrophota bacterium]
MAYSISVESLLDKSNNSLYKLVILASRRALEIAEGQPKLVAGNSATKPSTIALREIAAGKVTAKKVKSKE